MSPGERKEVFVDFHQASIISSAHAAKFAAQSTTCALIMITRRLNSEARFAELAIPGLVALVIRLRVSETLSSISNRVNYQKLNC